MKDHTLSHSLDAAASYLGAPQLLKQNRPIQCLESGAHRKTTHFRFHRSFPNMGGPGVSAQPLSPDDCSGPRPGSHGLSLPWASEGGVTGLVYAAHRNAATGTHGRPGK